MCINIDYLHHNPEEWQNPSEYIPERFDPESPYYLTPAGKKRHPQSFSPFLGGRRVCLGKTFADLITKTMVSIIVYQVDLKLKDPVHYTKRPMNRINSEKKPVVMA